jgi:hypothetical protein
MKRIYKAGIDRQQAFLLPPRLDEYVAADNPVRAIDTYVDAWMWTGWGSRMRLGN